MAVPVDPLDDQCGAQQEQNEAGQDPGKNFEKPPQESSSVCMIRLPEIQFMTLTQSNPVRRCWDFN